MLINRAKKRGRHRAVVEIKKLNRAVDKIKAERDHGIDRAGNNTISDELGKDAHQSS
jgi:hypothetical protein